jgi:hypothetical protein
MRVIDADVREALEREATPHAMLAFLTIEHPTLAEPIRLVSDVMDYVWGAETWIGMPFDFAQLTDEDGAPSAEIRVQNVDRRIGKALRALPDRATLRLDILTSADFDLSVDPRVEVGTALPVYSFSHVELVDATVNAIEVTGRVFLRDPTQEPWPGVSATQTRCPGLFR